MIRKHAGKSARAVREKINSTKVSLITRDRIDEGRARGATSLKADREHRLAQAQGYGKGDDVIVPTRHGDRQGKVTRTDDRGNVWVSVDGAPEKAFGYRVVRKI